MLKGVLKPKLSTGAAKSIRGCSPQHLGPALALSWRNNFTDCISEEGNAIASVRPSVRPFVYFLFFDLTGQSQGLG